MAPMDPGEDGAVGGTALIDRCNYLSAGIVFMLVWEEKLHI